MFRAVSLKAHTICQGCAALLSFVLLSHVCLSVVLSLRSLFDGQNAHELKSCCRDDEPRFQCAAVAVLHAPSAVDFSYTPEPHIAFCTIFVHPF